MWKSFRNSSWRGSCSQAAPVTWPCWRGGQRLRRPWLLLGSPAPTVPGKIYAKRLSLQSKAGWRGGKSGALGWLLTGSEEGSVVRLLFDVLDGYWQLWTQSLVGCGHVQVLFLHTHGDD